MSIELVTFPDVEIMTEGTYPCLTGVHTFTREDLESAVAAVAGDPAIKDPRFKIGHVGNHGEPNIGLPVFGRYTNLHIVEAADGKAKLYGDVVGVPAWFAQIMPTAYPNRSIEGKWDVETSTGNVHKFVIQAVSCLGVDLPAIDTLDDLKIVYEKGPDGLETEVVAQFSGGKPAKVNTTQEVQAMTPEQIQRLRASAGLTEEQLPDDATEEQISSAYDAVDERLTQSAPEPAEEPNPAPESHEEPASPEEPTEEPTEPVAASSGVTVERSAWEETQRDAQLGREARAQQLTERRNGFVEAAITDGKIPPSRREHYRNLMERDEEGTVTFLDSLEKNVIPVKAQEKGSGDDSESAAVAAQEAGIRNWFPELKEAS